MTQASKIMVVDSIMGSGKTSAMISYINSHPENNYIFITPFLAEVQRIKDSTVQPFLEPKNYGNGKLDNLKQLLAENHNIAASHSLFLMTDAETEDLIKAGAYTLILDETLDVVTPYNSDYPHNTIKRGDIALLLQKQLISIDDYGMVTWTDYGSYDDFTYSVVEKLARAGNLICIDNELFLCQFPARIFGLFNDVFVLTYQFEGSILKSYFDYYSIPFERRSAIATAPDCYEITDYYDDRDIRRTLKDKISVVDDIQLTAIGAKPSALSKSWYRNAQKEKIDQIKKNCNTFLRNRVTDAKASRIMWTSFKDDYKAIVDRGYKYVRKLTKEDRQLPEREVSKLNCFVSCNARATNDFAERDILMYLVNRYPDPEIGKFFAKKGVDINREIYALNEMIQWIWRSAIRNGQPIHIYIPSSRMRGLLLNWLDGKI